jgi:NTE family protein
MTDKPKIGLALSGGVGYCLAHIGVIKALEQRGLEADVVAGTSGGALIGCLYASGLRSDRLEQIAREISWTKLMSPTMVFREKGLLSSEPIEKLVDQLIGTKRRFNEMKLPLSVTAVDLISGKAINFPNHPDDLIAPAVRASCSVPIVYAPLKMGNWLLSDGGILDPLPMEPLKRFKPDVTIAVSFMPGQFEPNSLFEIGVRSMEIANIKESQLSHKEADILIELQTGQVSSWDLKSALSLIELGQKAAEKALEASKEKLSAQKPFWFDMINNKWGSGS